MSEYDRKDYLMRWGLHSVRGLRCIITHSAKCCSCLPHRLHIYKMCFLKLLISTPLLFTLPKSGNSLCACFLNICVLPPRSNQQCLVGLHLDCLSLAGLHLDGQKARRQEAGGRILERQLSAKQSIYFGHLARPPSTLTKTFLALFSTVFLFFGAVLSTKIHKKINIFSALAL